MIEHTITVDGEILPIYGPWLYVHPLQHKKLTRGSSYAEWLEKWSQADSAEECTGLLHALTTNRAYWQKEFTVPFLLQIADGHLEGKDYFVGDEEKVNYGPDWKGELEDRLAIAQKAQSVLVSKFFKSVDQWDWALGDDVTFQRLLWFFRPVKYSNRQVMNCPPRKADHESEVVLEFLWQFAKVSWARARDRKYNVKHCLLLLKARPQLLPILRHLGQLEWIIDDLDPVSRRTLTHMAMEEKVHVPGEKWREEWVYRHPRSLAEAVVGGSAPAKVLIIHQQYQAVHDKAAARRQKDKERQEAQCRAKELADLEKEKQRLQQRARELTATRSMTAKK